MHSVSVMYSCLCSDTDTSFSTSSCRHAGRRRADAGICHRFALIGCRAAQCQSRGGENGRDCAAVHEHCGGGSPVRERSAERLRLASRSTRTEQFRLLERVAYPTQKPVGLDSCPAERRVRCALRSSHTSAHCARVWRTRERVRGVGARDVLRAGG